MKAEIISVGTELLLGHTINTDAAIVARFLAELGIDLLHAQTVGDNPARLHGALELAASRSDIIITTGGLGPTKDDLTKETVARFAGLPLVMDVRSEKMLKEYFGLRPMSANQMKQAFVPQGATVFANACGTAPGCAISLQSGRLIIVLPGPPAELRPMIEKEVRPFLLARTGQIILSTLVRTFGIGEGAAAERINDFLDLANPTVAPYASSGEMFVKITAKAASESEAKAMIAPVTKRISERLGHVVYGLDVSSLEETVVSELIAKGCSVATAESCTGGLLAGRITDIPGSSRVFHYGVVSYANEAKEKMLNVPKELLLQHGAVSPQVATAMAKNIRQISNSEIGIGISGVAGPDGGTPEKPVGLVYIAMAARDKEFLRVMRPQGRYPGRQWVRTRAASHALDMIRRFLADIPVEDQWGINAGN